MAFLSEISETAPDQRTTLSVPDGSGYLKVPRGRHLTGSHSVYDIDVGEVKPQIEITPLPQYGCIPVLGRQIAVNKTYLVYGHNLGVLKVLNMTNQLSSMVKGLYQRVTDLCFFAEDVHLLASASVDGRVYIWEFAEDPDEADKAKITVKMVTAVQFIAEGEPVNPRVCWHCHKQEVLVVGIGRHVLKIDTTKVGQIAYSAEEPLKCPIDKLTYGIQLVGFHDGEVTDLSICQWGLVSASVDGTIKIWEVEKMLPIAVLRPHDGQPVNSVMFLTAPHCPDQTILITGGPLNHEVKLWVSASEEGWLLPSDLESWRCIQTLELKSSEMQEAFFNQVIELPQAGLLLLANAKKKAIYAVHLDFGTYPASSRMDFVSEFTVTMPIWSFTGTSSVLPNGEQIVQVYCIQTQAIRQFALDLSQWFPSLDKSGSSASCDAIIGDIFVSSAETKASELTASATSVYVYHGNGFKAFATESRSTDVDGKVIKSNDEVKFEIVPRSNVVLVYSGLVQIFEDICKNISTLIEGQVGNIVAGIDPRITVEVVSKCVHSRIIKILDQWFSEIDTYYTGSQRDQKLKEMENYNISVLCLTATKGRRVESVHPHKQGNYTNEPISDDSLASFMGSGGGFIKKFFMRPSTVVPLDVEGLLNHMTEAIHHGIIEDVPKSGGPIRVLILWDGSYWLRVVGQKDKLYLKPEDPYDDVLEDGLHFY